MIQPSPYPSFLAPSLAYIRELRAKNPDGWVTAVPYHLEREGHVGTFAAIPVFTGAPIRAVKA